MPNIMPLPTIILVPDMMPAPAIMLTTDIMSGSGIGPENRARKADNIAPASNNCR